MCRLSLLINLGFTVLATFAVLLAPWLRSLSDLQQVAHRIFPFARGLFEDKVANVWCALNVVIKLRTLASVAILARMSLLATLLAVLPSVIGLLWVSWSAGQKQRVQANAQMGQSKSRPSASRSQTSEYGHHSYAPATKQPERSMSEDDATTQTPTIVLLPHALFVSALAFFLFSFQVHEKSILLPLMPLTLLMGAREAGYGRMDWEWAVLLNNVGVYR